MATVPTVTVGGIDQTSHIQHKTLYMRLKSLDFTLIDPASDPDLHDIVSVDVPDWHGRVSTVESRPFRSASGANHRLVAVTATNKHVAPADTAPFGISDTPNLSTTYPYKDFTYIQTLADQSDLSSAEHRLTATVYQPGLLPGMTVAVTSVAEGLSADPFIITEVQVTWLMDDSPEYKIEASVEGNPAPDLGDLIDSQGCDCAPFVSCDEPDYTVHSFADADVLAAVFPNHANGQTISSTDYMVVYRTATYRIDYLVFHAADSNGLGATLAEVGGSALGSFGPPYVTGFGTVAPAVNMGNKAMHCHFGSPDDIPAASTEWTVPGGVGSTMNVKVALIEESCNAGDSFASSVSAHITWLSGPDPRFSDLAPCADTPHSGQRINPESFTGNGVVDSVTLQWPYMPGTIELYVEGVDWTNLITETDPGAGQFSTTYPFPVASDPFDNVFVHYRYP